MLMFVSYFGFKAFMIDFYHHSGLVEAAPTITTIMAQTAGFDVHPFFFVKI